MNILDPKDMLALQGNLVLVYRHEEKDGRLRLDHLLTIVRVVDVESQHLRLVDRGQRSSGRIDIEFTQKWCDKLRPAPADNKLGAEWEVTLIPKKNGQAQENNGAALRHPVSLSD